MWEEIFAGLARLMRRQTQIESRLSAALTRFQQAGAALPEGVVVLDDGDRIEWCNPRAEAYFGLDSQRDRGQQITYLIRQPQFVAVPRGAAASTSRWCCGSRATRRELILSIQLVPYGDSDKLLLSRDITRWERLETTRRDFVANVSHELRTPLTVLNGFLETLADMPKPDPEMTKRSIAADARADHPHASAGGGPAHAVAAGERPQPAARGVRRRAGDLARQLYREAQALSAGRHRIALRVDCRVGLIGSTRGTAQRASAT